MNILFLAPRLPLPADTGGKIRTLNILKQLALKNHIHLLCFTFEEKDNFHAQELHDLGIKVQLIPISEVSIVKKIVAVAFNSLPFSITKYQTAQMTQKIKEELAKQKFDAVHIDHLHMAVYKNCFKDMCCFLDEHNVEYKILERCANVEKSWIKKTLYQNQSRKMINFESQKVKEFTGVFACSTEDQNLLIDLGKNQAKVHVVPNGVDTEYFKKSEDKNVDASLVFTGSMDWLPNDDAITYFCKEILPLAWIKNSALKLSVVGKNPSKLVKELSLQDNRVIVTGRVEDVRPYVKNANIFIVPLRIGGGTRLKILEAMAMGKAVISTSIGAEGIECKDSVNIAIADTPNDFAQRIIDLNNSPELIALIGQEGRKLVCQQYDWNIVGKKLNSIYQENTHANN